MAKITLPGFDDLDTENQKDMFDTEMTVEGEDIMVCLTFDPKGPRDEDHATPLRKILADLDNWVTRAREAAKREADDEAVALYLEHHRDETDLLDDVSDHDAIDAMMCTGICLSPDEPDLAVNVDLSVGEDETQYVLCVRFTLDGTVTTIDMES